MIDRIMKLVVGTKIYVVLFVYVINLQKNNYSSHSLLLFKIFITVLLLIDTRNTSNVCLNIYIQVVSTYIINLELFLPN